MGELSEWGNCGGWSIHNIWQFNRGISKSVTAVFVVWVMWALWRGGGGGGVPVKTEAQSGSSLVLIVYVQNKNQHDSSAGLFFFLGFLCVNPRAGEWWWQEVLEIISGLSPSGWGKGAARTLFMDIMTKGSLVSPRIKCSNNNVEQYVPISLKFGSKTKPSSCFTLFFSTASLGWSLLCESSLCP